MLDTPLTVLVAEDNAALRRVIGHALKGAGFEVTAAPDGQAAWELAQEASFDLVVTDQQMPRKSGLELIESLRGVPEYDKTPVVLLTAKGMELEFDRIREEYGITAMLAKPFSPSQLGTLAKQLASQPV